MRMTPRNIPLVLCIILPAAVLTACSHQPFVSIDAAGEPVINTRSPLPLVCGVAEMPPLDRNYGVYDYPGGNQAILDATRAELVEWLDRADVFWLVDAVEKLPCEPDLVVRPVVVRFGWMERGGAATPYIYSVFTGGLYPVVGGSFWWPRAYFRLGVNVVDRRGKVVAGFVGREEVREGTSLYSAWDYSPQVQVNRALGHALNSLARQMLKRSDPLLTAGRRNGMPGEDLGEPLVRFTVPDGKMHRRPTGPYEVRGRVLAPNGIKSLEFRSNGRILDDGQVKVERVGKTMAFFTHRFVVLSDRNVFECRVLDGRKHFKLGYTTIIGESENPAPKAD